MSLRLTQGDENLSEVVFDCAVKRRADEGFSRLGALRHAFSKHRTASHFSAAEFNQLSLHIGQLSYICACLQPDDSLLFL
jgi:hypothetical protein